MILSTVKLKLGRYRYRAIHVSPTAPPRRARERVVEHTSVSIPPRRIRRLPSSPAPSVTPSPQPSVSEQDHFNAPLYTLKAFSIATAIVMLSVTASVAGVMAYLDVRNTAEFAARMRTWVSQSMPLLTARIYRRPTPHDSVDGDPILFTASTPQHEPSSPTLVILDYDVVQQILAEAFDKGGFDAWVEAAARETETEVEVKRSQAGKLT